MATLYLEIVRELKRDMFVHTAETGLFHYLIDSVGKDMRHKYIISFFWSKMSNCMLVLCTNTLTKNTTVVTYIHKRILLAIAHQHLKHKYLDL